MKRGVNVLGLIAVLIVIGSLFMGIVSTEVIVADVNKDIAVTNVNTTPSSPDLEQPTVIYVTVTNEGEPQEDNVSVKVYVDSSQIGSTQYISLAPGSSNITTFLWSPTTAKAYSVKGEVEIVNGEIDIKDNTKSIKVRVSAVPTPMPGTPSNPSPSNHTPDVYINTNLDWSDCSNTDFYDLYFGTYTHPPYYGNAPTSNYPFQNDLGYNTKYYWKIVAKSNGGGITQGPIWDFNTEEAPNQLPTAIIDSITPDPAEQGTDTVSFTGHGTDPDGTVEAYNWSSSMDGQLSTSAAFTKPASELSVGTHTIYFKVQDDDGTWSTEDTVDLTIYPGPELSYSPESHDFCDMREGETDNATFEIWNSGTDKLTYSLSETCDWLEVHPTSGSSTGEHNTITVDMDTTGLFEGSHTCDITINSNDGSGTFTVMVNVMPCPCGNISVNPTSLSTTLNYSESDKEIVTVSATGGTIKGVTVGKVSGPTWLSVSKTDLGDIASGSSKTFTITASPPSETSGDFPYTVTVSNTCGTPSTRDVSGTIHVDCPDSSWRYKVCKWTYMVYLDGDNNLEGAGIDDFMEMSSVYTTSDVNIVVQFDRIPGYDNSYGDWTDCKRFHVTYGMTPMPANALINLGECNMGDPNTLRYFVDWAMSNFPADNYALILWNHGSGWKSINKWVPWADDLKDAKDAGVTRGICVDNTNNDYLSLQEIEQALTGKYVQLLGYDACLMHMIEVVYQVMTNAGVSVGSEEVEPWDGWPYDTILNDLTGTPTMNEDALGTVIVDRYMDSYGYTGSETQSAVDNLKLPNLVTAVDNLAHALINEINAGHWTQVQQARYAAEEIYYNYYIDLYHFAEKIPLYVPNATAQAQAVMNEVSGSVYEAHGTSVLNDHGLSIYFPRVEGDYLASYDNTAFASDTEWDEFLKRYYEGPELVCEGTATSCGIYPNCENCNEDDGCYPYGSNGCEERNYYCVSNEVGCGYIYSNRHTDYYDDWDYYCDGDTVRKHRLFHDYYCDGGTCTDHTSLEDDQLVENCNDHDGWVDTGNTDWVDVNECQEKARKEQEYRDYYCSGGACTYNVTGTQWVDTENTRNKPDGTICDCTASNTLKRCYSGVCTDTGICDSTTCGADAACDGKKPGESCDGDRKCDSNCKCRAVGEDTAVFRNGWWFADQNGDHITDICFKYGILGDEPVVGDINNDGSDDVAILRNGWWYVSNAAHSGTDYKFKYGISGDKPVVGDINNDGSEDAAIFRNGWWYVSNAAHSGTDYKFKYGIAGDEPVVGDINNDGSDDVAIFRKGWWYVSKPDHSGTAYKFKYGISGDIPVVGDINNDGSDDVAIFRNGRWYVSKPDHSGTAYKFKYGISGDIPVVGDIG